MSKRTSYLFILATSSIILSLVIRSLERIEYPANSFIVSLPHPLRNADRCLNQEFAAHLPFGIYSVDHPPGAETKFRIEH